MEDRFQNLISELKSASPSGQDILCEEILQIGQSNPSEAASILKRLLKFERLNLQWLLEEVIETLDPPPTTKSDEELDDPSKRALRSSELELVYNDPRGIRLYKSNVDSRWMLIQIDPQTGMPMQQELQPDQAEMIKQQLGGSPYWVKPEYSAPAPSTEDPAPKQQAEAGYDVIYEDPSGVQIHKSQDSDEWIMTRPDPVSGAPTKQNLSPSMIQSLKVQLADSPYWLKKIT